MILLACAVERELGAWADRVNVEPLVTGIGPVEAAAAIAGAVARRSYRFVVSAGLAGAFDGAARVGDGVIVAEDWLELTLEGGAAIPLPDGIEVTSRAHSDPALVERMRSCGFAVLRGVTVAQVTSTEATAARLAALGAQVESMEGFAALRACERARVPAIQVRGVSNRVGDRTRSRWDFAAGLAGLTRVAEAVIEALDPAAGARA